MKLTDEERLAFDRANRSHSIVKWGKNNYKIRMPYRDSEPEGIRTESNGSYSYFNAKQIRARYVAFCALILCGWDSSQATVVTDFDVTGKAIDIFKDALAGKY